MAPHARGIDPKLEKGWIHSIEREDEVRLKWFRKHEERLNEIANATCSRTVPEEAKEKFAKGLIENFRNVQRFSRKKVEEAELISPGKLMDIMRPVDHEVKKMIYEREVDGRKRYLQKRAHLLPEKRYYLPECSSWIYGWNIFDTMKTLKRYPFGREEVIKHSFYRRRGIEREPDWYRKPAAFSPNICTAE
ncbi:protein ATP6V1FNB-like [Diorhabda carinulata]|uniref:protein ATP6V1FNB-like n=1 Tax=Diorhabda carinulata TaxID=1163345 RepID=UPI0025A0416E|nr:protein ATP6V1FNB-like [Diorhabda carinulata]